MKNLAGILLLLSVLLACSIATNAQSRPRRAGQAPPPSQTEPQPDTTAPSDQTAPVQPRPRPVLIRSDPSADGKPTSNTPARRVPAGPEEVSDGEVIKVDSTLVTLPVSVMDRDGKFVGHLRQDDFRVFEDGVEQKVAYFAPVEQPFVVALLLDMSGSTRNHLGEIQDAALAFVDQLRPNDRVIVISFDDHVHVLARATNDRQQLRTAILAANSGDGTSLYEAIDQVINRQFSGIEGRKAIVLFSDGVDTTSKHASYEQNVQDAEELDATFYAIEYDTFGDVNAGSAGGGGRGSWPGTGPTFPTGNNPGGIIGIIFGGRNSRRQSGGGGAAGGSSADYARADSYLNEMAQVTGGRVQRAGSIRDIDAAFANIADELRLQYSLGYYPSQTYPDGQRHALRVRVMRPNLVVRTKGTYITGQQTTAAKSAQRSASPAPLPRIH